MSTIHHKQYAIPSAYRSSLISIFLMAQSYTQVGAFSPSSRELLSSRSIQTARFDSLFVDQTGKNEDESPVPTNSLFVDQTTTSAGAFTGNSLFVDLTSKEEEGKKHDNSMFVDQTFVEESVQTKEEPVKEKLPVTDVNGEIVAPGDVIRVAVEGLSAYHVGKAKGWFNENKEFVADDSVGRKSLKLPVGLQGVVIRVIDTAEISASSPLLVKFTPGEYVDEGFDTPVPFQMHFLGTEVELVKS